MKRPFANKPIVSNDKNGQGIEGQTHLLYDDVIEAHNVSKEYGAEPALKNISVRLFRNDKTAFIGPSGAGKTTLLKVLSGALLPSSGSLSINHDSAHNSYHKKDEQKQINDIRHEIAFIHQDFGLSQSLTVAQNVACGRLGKIGFWKGVRSVLFPTKAELEEIYLLLKQLGIEETLYKPVAQLSGGELQRVAIGRALYQKPKILFADEPVASLDPARARSLLALLTELCETHDLMLCVSLHNVELAKQFFDRLIGLRNGEIIFDTTPEQLTSSDVDALYDITDQADKGKSSRGHILG